MIEHTKQFLGRRLTLLSHRSCSYLEGLTTSKYLKEEENSRGTLLQFFGFR